MLDVDQIIDRVIPALKGWHIDINSYMPSLGAVATLRAKRRDDELLIIIDDCIDTRSHFIQSMYSTALRNGIMTLFLGGSLSRIGNVSVDDTLLPAFRVKQFKNIDAHYVQLGDSRIVLPEFIKLYVDGYIRYSYQLEVVESHCQKCGVLNIDCKSKLPVHKQSPGVVRHVIAYVHDVLYKNKMLAMYSTSSECVGCSKPLSEYAVVTSHKVYIPVHATRGGSWQRVKYPIADI